MILKAHESISPELRDYRTIEVKDLAFFQRAGIRLSAPEGVRLSPIPD
jgi:hypothetical protein